MSINAVITELGTLFVPTNCSKTIMLPVACVQPKLLFFSLAKCNFCNYVLHLRTLRSASHFTQYTRTHTILCSNNHIDWKLNTQYRRCWWICTEVHHDAHTIVVCFVKGASLFFVLSSCIGRKLEMNGLPQCMSTPQKPQGIVCEVI